MAEIKRFRLMDEQGNVIIYDIAAGSITFDDRNMTLPQVIEMLEAAIEVAGQVKTVTLNGSKIEPDEETGDINLGTVLTEHQDISGKANKDEMAVTNGATADKKVIQLKNGLTLEVIVAHQDMSGKVDKEQGKGLSSNDYTDTEKTKLAGIAAGAQVNVKPDWNAASGNAAEILNKPTIPNKTSDLTKDDVYTKGEVDDAIDDALNNVVIGTVEGAVIDNLLSDSPTDSLSAHMGKQLAEDMEDIPYINIGVVGNKIVINTNAALSPRVNIGALSSSSLSARAGNTDTATFTVSGRRLTAALTAALSDSTHFSISSASLSPSSGVVEETTLTVTYNPSSGATAGTSHSLTITIASDGVTYGTLSLTGTVAAAPSLTLSPASLAISAESGQQGTGTLNVQGTALDADVTLTLSGSSYMSFESGSSVTTKTIAKADAMASGGADVTIYYTGTASDSGTITASSTGATSATASVSGSVASRLSEGDTITKDGMTFTVLADTTKVSIKATSSSSVSGNLVIPSSVHDSNGFSYAVTACAMYAFKNCTSLTGVTIPDSITSYGSGYTFQSCQNMASVTLGSGATTLGSNMFYDCRELTSIVIPDSVITLGGEMFKGCKKLATIQIGTSTDCACTTANNSLKNACGQSVSSNGSDSALRTLICYAATPPTFGLYDTGNGYGLPSSFYGEGGNGTLKVPSSAVSTYENSSESGKTLWAKIPTIQAIE